MTNNHYSISLIPGQRMLEANRLWSSRPDSPDIVQPDLNHDEEGAQVDHFKLFKSCWQIDKTSKCDHL